MIVACIGVSICEKMNNGNWLSFAVLGLMCVLGYYLTKLHDYIEKNNIKK